MHQKCSLQLYPGMDTSGVLLANVLVQESPEVCLSQECSVVKMVSLLGRVVEHHQPDLGFYDREVLEY